MSNTVEQIKEIIGQSLQIPDRAAGFDASTALLGSLPELDSMAVVGVITALEEYYDFEVDDDEINAEVFASIGSLAEFVDAKQAG